MHLDWGRSEERLWLGLKKLISMLFDYIHCVFYCFITRMILHHEGGELRGVFKDLSEFLGFRVRVIGLAWIFWVCYVGLSDFW